MSIVSYCIVTLFSFSFQVNLLALFRAGLQFGRGELYGGGVPRPQKEAVFRTGLDEGFSGLTNFPSSVSGPWHFPSKFPSKVALVTCPSAFRLRRLAQNVCPRSGLTLGPGIFPINFCIKGFL